MKYFCGVIAETVESKTNVLHVRFFADKGALKSKFTMLYTAYREKGADSKYFTEIKYMMMPYASHILITYKCSYYISNHIIFFFRMSR